LERSGGGGPELGKQRPHGFEGAGRGNAAFNEKDEREKPRGQSHESPCVFPIHAGRATLSSARRPSFRSMLACPSVPNRRAVLYCASVVIINAGGAARPASLSAERRRANRRPKSI